MRIRRNTTRYFKARDESLSHIMSVYYCFLQFAFRSTDISTSAAVLIGIDPLLAIFLILPAVSSVFYKRANDLNYESDLIKKKHRRPRAIMRFALSTLPTLQKKCARETFRR